MDWLDGHVNLESHPAKLGRPTLERMRVLMEHMGSPQLCYPTIHITGTNGKGSVAEMITRLLMAKGLNVGTYTSPNLHRVNERIAYNGSPINDEDLEQVLSFLKKLESSISVTPTRFELLTAAAFYWFSDTAVDAAVVEVGIGGRWDATNVTDGLVSVITNVSKDHLDILGPTLQDVAKEKAGIIKQNSAVVLGETDDVLKKIFIEHANDVGAEMILERSANDSGSTFGCSSNLPAYKGRVVDIFTPWSTYPQLYIPLHGEHQGDNGASALAAAEAFFKSSFTAELASQAFSSLNIKGRLEVISQKPLCLVDGAHNPAGMAMLGRAVAEEFLTIKNFIIVVGMLNGRDPVEMLQQLIVSSGILPSKICEVIACAPRSERAMPTERIVQAGLAVGVTKVTQASSVRSALNMAYTKCEIGNEVGVSGANVDATATMVVVTGSLYVVAEAIRAHGMAFSG
ncbi:MAG: bifunctional folylpolyglutamate synthase/dihydrofolate synthase [Actinobacteria bacterium]|nr:bifunctional folylpolyglutamate synthase/dihydrofolate synthase [Actinomycetota bacterium]